MKEFAYEIALPALIIVGFICAVIFCAFLAICVYQEVMNRFKNPNYPKYE